METTKANNHKSPALAAILSLLFTGVGNIYAGNAKVGLILLGLALFNGFLCVGISPGFFIVSIVLAVYSSFYAYEDAVLANEGKSFVREGAQSPLPTQPRNTLFNYFIGESQSPLSTQASSKNPFLDQLGILSSLHDAGILSDDEFKDKKESLIRQLTPMTPCQTNSFLLSLVDVYKSGTLTQDDLDLIKSTIK